MVSKMFLTLKVAGTSVGIVFMGVVGDNLSSKTSISVGEALAACGVLLAAAWWLATTYQKMTDGMSQNVEAIAQLREHMDELRTYIDGLPCGECLDEKGCMHRKRPAAKSKD
jgi:hypothetical protein